MPVIAPLFLAGCTFFVHRPLGAKKGNAYPDSKNHGTSALAKDHKHLAVDILHGTFHNLRLKARVHAEIARLIVLEGKE